MDRFLQHFIGRLGPTNQVHDMPMGFVYKKERFFVQGYRVLHKFLIGIINCILLEGNLPEKIALLKDKNRTEYGDAERVFLQIIKKRDLRCLWADTCAYQVQLDRDTKGGRYVDKRRFDTNMNSYRAALKTTLKETECYLQQLIDT